MNKLSDEVKNYMQIAKEGKNSLTVYGALKSFLPEVEKLENDNNELLNALTELVKITEYMNIAHIQNLKNKILIEKHHVKNGGI